ncbi:signaling threshold-regulating transmembrane adapter 1 isoform X2 [Alligator sinensis]|uniref:Signaling threshold-regulating transmembrane adapter 1 isoform X2 n=1 Tax=Alligator sinensis TaxID=38654 RepID=A0A3Q0HCM8_ALLSI|nr:signaling threshold-regulating transmembrane adapter 1 isoform X2 [Alligator sinensis]
MDFCLDGSVFATAGTDRHIRLYDSCTMQLFHTLEAPDFMTGDVAVTSGASRRIFALRFHPQENHIFLTGGWDNSVKVWDKRIRKEAQRVINGPHICGPGLDIWVRWMWGMWRGITGDVASNMPVPGLGCGHLTRRYLMVPPPAPLKETSFVPGSAAHLSRAPLPHWQPVLTGSGVHAGVDMLHLPPSPLPQGHCVLTASWVPRNALQLWDLRTSQLQKNLPFPGGHTQGQFLYAAQFCDPDTVLAGGSGTCGAGVIRISTHQVLGQILLPHKPVQAVAVACGGCVVAVAGVGGNLHIADLC